MTTGITKGQVKKAGRILATRKMPDEEYSWALDVADSWRAAHKEVIEEMKALLGSVADGCDESLSGEILIVSRLKLLVTFSVSHALTLREVADAALKLAEESGGESEKPN